MDRTLENLIKLSAEGATCTRMNLSGKRTKKGMIILEQFFNSISEVNSVINEFVWVKIGLILLVGTGILMTICTRFFQLSHLKHWWVTTIGSVFKKNSAATKKTDKQSISQFQALCTALAATIGTGNIAGVSAAIVTGGAGAVF